MWFQKLFFLLFPVLSIGIQIDETAIFSVNYFKERNAHFVCLLSCGNQTWDVEFAKAAASHSISVSSMSAMDVSKNTKHCFQQYFNYIGVMLHANCGDVKQIFYTASRMRWFDFKHIWLIISEEDYPIVYTNGTLQDSKKFSKVFQIFNNLNISVDADIIFATKQDNQYRLTDIYNYGKLQGGNLIVTDIGVWKPDEENNELLSILNGCKYHRRHDFQKIGMRLMYVMATEPLDPQLILTSVRPVKGLVTIQRIATIILNEIAQIHNFKFVYTRAEKWLGTYETNASRAVATSLFFEEQDISPVFRYLDILFGRVMLIHPCLTALETKYFYRIPTTGPGKFENQFLRPLSAGTWFTLLAISAMCTVIMVLSCRWESRPSSIQYGLFSVTAIVCQQFFEDNNCDMLIRRISTARKLTTFVIGISAVLVYNFYTSSVVSWLLNGPPPSITSLKELLDSPLEIIFEDVGYTRSWLTVPNYYFNVHNAEVEDALKRRVQTKRRKVPLFMEAEEGIAMVEAGGYAYLTEPYNANPLISASFDKAELCELGSLTSIRKVNIYPGLQLNSPYKEFFTWSLTRLLETGIVSCIQRRTSTYSVACEGSSPRALALGGAAPAFILLAGGYLVAVGIMLVERCIYKVKQRKQSLKRFV